MLFLRMYILTPFDFGSGRSRGQARAGEKAVEVTAQRDVRMCNMHPLRCVHSYSKYRANGRLLPAVRVHMRAGWSVVPHQQPSRYRCRHGDTTLTRRTLVQLPIVAPAVVLGLCGWESNHRLIRLCASSSARGALLTRHDLHHIGASDNARRISCQRLGW